MSEPSRGSTYEEHAARETKLYGETFMPWWLSLSEKERMDLVAQGIKGPLVESDAATKQVIQPDGSDPAEWSAASYTTDIATEIDGLAGQLVELFNMDAKMAALVAAWHAADLRTSLLKNQAAYLNRIVGNLLMPGNVKVRVGALGLAVGLQSVEHVVGTETELAARCLVSRACVSKEVQRWRRDLDLRQSAHMKTDGAIASCKKAQKTNHWRNRGICTPTQQPSQ